jgi:hypothetical protein
MVALERELPLVLAPAVSADAIPSRLRRHGGTPRQVLAMTIVGSLVLALFAAADLPSWADRLDDGPFVGIARTVAVKWERTTETLGLTQPHEALRTAMRRMLDWRW